MPAKNPRLFNTNQPLPMLIAAVLGAGTSTALMTAASATVDIVIKQIILTNLNTTAEVVHICSGTSTTVTSANRIIETSVPADSTTILYVNIRLSSTYLLSGLATTTNMVNVVLVGDAEAV